MAKSKTDLVIVESPAKARTIEKYLGPNYQVVASMGHLRDLPKSTMGVDIENGFEPDYQPVKAREDVIADLKKRAIDAESAGERQDCPDHREKVPWRDAFGENGAEGSRKQSARQKADRGHRENLPAQMHKEGQRNHQRQNEFGGVDGADLSF